MNKGVFISFEGGDGAGKTTQIKRMIEKLQPFLVGDQKIISLREPGGTAFGERLRSILKDPARPNILPIPELLMFFAARAQLVQEVIRPALEAGHIVVVDRFIDSSFAYQGYGRGISTHEIQNLVEMTVDPMPDLTFLLEIDPLTARQRLFAENGLAGGDHFDELDEQFFQRVQAGYERRKLNYPFRIVPIDGSKSEVEVSRLIWRSLMDKQRDIRELVLCGDSCF